MTEHRVVRRLARVVGPFVFYLLVTLLALGPSLHRLDTDVVGWECKDQPEYTWSLWYSARALLQGKNPADLAILNHPDGYFHEIRLATLTTYVTALPLSWLPPRDLYNAMVVLGSTLTGLVTYRLALDHTGRHGPALLAGVVYLLFPSRWAHVLGGHLETGQTYWYPLALLTLRRLKRSPSAGCALLNAAVWAGAVMNSLPGTAYVLVPLAAAYGTHTLAWARRRRRLWPVARAMVVSAVIGLLILAPFIAPLASALMTGDSRLIEGGDSAFSVDLVSLVAPPPDGPLWEALGSAPRSVADAVFHHPQETMGYLGVTVLALATLAVSHNRRGTEPTLLLAIAAAACVLSLGPALHIGGRPVSFTIEGGHDTRVPLPYALVSTLPGFSVGRTPGRFLLLAGLMLSQLAAIGCARLTSWVPRQSPTRAIITGCATMAIAVGYTVAWPPPTYNLRTPAAIIDLAAMPAGGVLNVPVSHRQVGQEGLYYQMTHGHPMVGGYIHRSLSTFPGQAELLDWVTRPTSHLGLNGVPSDSDATAVLSAAGVDYVVLHKGYAVNPDATASALASRLGPAVASDTLVEVYRVTDRSLPQTLLWADQTARWENRTDLDGEPARWLSDDGWKLGIYSPSRQTVNIALRGVALDHARRLAVVQDGQRVGQIVIGPHADYTLPQLDLPPGPSSLTVSDLGDCRPVAGDPRCLISRGFLTDAVGCNLWDRTDRCVGTLITDLRVAPCEPVPSGTTIGPLSLLAVSVPSCSPTDAPLAVEWTWRVDSPLGAEPHAFVHLLAEEGSLVAQDDVVPYRPWHPFDEWIPGDTMTSSFHLITPGDTAPGTYRLSLGIYSYPEMARWPVSGSGAVWEDSVIDVGTVEITESCRP